MFAEYNERYSKMFLYGSDSFSMIEDHKYQIISKEMINGNVIFTLRLNQSLKLSSDFGKITNKIQKVFCKHGNQIIFESIASLPHEGWEELIDSWSCHKSEFKTLLELKPVERSGRILISNFYMLIPESMLPACCKTKTKVFFNELVLPVSHHEVVFHFFYEYFQERDLLLFEFNENSIEIKYFYTCFVKSDKFPNWVNALKIGYKINRKKSTNTINGINAFFIDKIRQQILLNTLDIEIMGYKLSFITQNQSLEK